MFALIRHPGFALIATLAAGLFLFGGYCHLHAAAAGVTLPWEVPLRWGMISGVPAAAFAFLLWRWRDRITARLRPFSLAAVVFVSVLAWGIVARGVIGPGEVPDALGLVEQLFVVLPVAAAVTGATAVSIKRRTPLVEGIPASPWIELPEEPLLRLRTDEVGWVGAAGNYCEFHAAGRVHLIRVPLSRAAGYLTPLGFARAHRSTLVNLAALTSVEPGGAARRPVARLRCGTTLPVGASFRDTLLAAIAERSSRR
jgi:two-component system LytT family response regulator